MAISWAEWPVAQSTTVDCVASGSKSLKQSPSWKSSGLTPSSGSGPRLAGADDVVAAAAGEASATGCSVLPPSEVSHQISRPRTTTAADGGADLRGALAADPGRPAVSAFLRSRLVRPRPGRRRRPARRPAPGPRPRSQVRRTGRSAGGRLRRGSAQAARPARRARRRSSGVAGGARRTARRALRTCGGGPFAGSTGRWEPQACRASPGLSFSSVTENSPLPCIVPRLGRPAAGPVSGSPLRNSIQDAGRACTPPGRRPGRSARATPPAAAVPGSSYR